MYMASCCVSEHVCQHSSLSNTSSPTCCSPWMLGYAYGQPCSLYKTSFVVYTIHLGSLQALREASGFPGPAPLPPQLHTVLGDGQKYLWNCVYRAVPQAYGYCRHEGRSLSVLKVVPLFFRNSVQQSCLSTEWGQRQ